jgi:hypothetical protein
MSNSVAETPAPVASYRTNLVTVLLGAWLTAGVALDARTGLLIDAVARWILRPGPSRPARLLLLAGVAPR